MNLSKAFALMRQKRNTALNFAFCEKGADGKPVLLMSTKSIAKDKLDEAMQGAKSKVVSKGRMLIDDEGAVGITPKGSAPSGLAKGVAVAAKNAKVSGVKRVRVLKEEPEETPEQPSVSTGNYETVKPANERTREKSDRAGKPQTPMNSSSSGQKDNYYMSPDLKGGASQTAPQNPPSSGATSQKDNDYMNPDLKGGTQQVANTSAQNSPVPNKNRPRKAATAGQPPRQQPQPEPRPHPSDDDAALRDDDNYNAVKTRPRRDSIDEDLNPLQREDAGDDFIPSSRRRSDSLTDDAPAPARQPATRPRRDSLDDLDNETPAREEEAPEHEQQQPGEAGTTTVASTPTSKSGYKGKKYEDPLKKNSILAKLIDSKEKIHAELNGMEGTANVDMNKVKQLLNRLDVIDKGMRAELQKQAKTGVTPKKLESDYANEDKVAGWRAWLDLDVGPPSPDETDEQVAARLRIPVQQVKVRRHVALTQTQVRRNYTEEEKKADALKIGPDGKVRDASGRLAWENNTEFISDPATGDMIKFRHETRPGPQVPTVNGIGKVTQTKNTHHSTPLSGGDVDHAGGVSIRNGEIQNVTNNSGHYKPKAGEMIQFLEQLMRKGALLSRDWCGPDGKPIDGNAKKIYDTAMGVQDKLEAKGNAGRDIEADLKSIEKAMAALKKLGYGPQNKINPNASVSFKEVTKDMTGLKVKMTEAKNFPVEDFMKGGNDSAEKKKKRADASTKLHDEMRGNKKFQEEREKAEKRVASPVSQKQLDAALKLIPQRIAKIRKRLEEIPAQRASERRELELAIVRLEKQLAEGAEATNEDLKKMLSDIQYIGTRLDGEILNPILEEEEEEGDEEGNSRSSNVGAEAEEDEEEEEDNDEDEDSLSSRVIAGAEEDDLMRRNLTADEARAILGSGRGISDRLQTRLYKAIDGLG